MVDCERAVEEAVRFICGGHDTARVKRLLLRRTTHSEKQILLVAQRLAMTEPLSETERLKLSDRLFETVFDPPQRSRGGDDLALSFRDMYLSDTVQHLIDEFGLAATRSAATRDKSGNESACSIVAKACARIGCNFSEDAIEKMCRHGRKHWKEHATTVGSESPFVSDDDPKQLK